MMQRKIYCFNIIISLLILLFFALPIRALNVEEGKGSKPSREEIDKKVTAWMKAGKIPGLTLVIIDNEKPVFIKGYGYADLDTKTPVTPETLFELASCSKSFTALALLQLEEKGAISQDSAVSDYLPWFYATYNQQKYKITIRQLLHHTSGIPWESISLIPRGKGDKALEQTVRNLTGIQLNNVPGQRFEYATVNYDILGAIIEKVSGKSYEEYMDDYVFKPLGLTDTIVGVQNKSQDPLRASGYKRGFFQPRKYNPPVLRGNNPAAYIISNGKDIARWLKFQLGLAESGFNTLMQKSHQPDLTVNPSRNLTSYAKGWVVNKYRNEQIFHTGLNPNFTTYIGFSLEEKIGVAVLANSNSPFTSFIANSIFRLLTGQEVPREYPQENKVDIYCSIISFVLGFYILCVVSLIIIKIISCFQGKSKYEPLTRGKFSRFIKSIVLSIPFLYGIYLIPRAIVHLSWGAALIWLPISFKFLVLLLLSSFAVSYILYILSLIVPSEKKYRNEIPLITITSMLSGIAGTALLFIVTTSFFSTIAVGYLLYYFGLTFIVNVGGRKLVQTKMINIANNIALDLRIDLINKIFSTKYQQFEKITDGRVFTTVNGDTGVLAGSAGLVVDFTTSVITSVSAFIYMTTISLISTLVVIAAVFCLILYYRVVAKKSRVYLEEARSIANVYMSLINSTIRGYKELCIHRRKKYEFREDLVNSTREYCNKTIVASILFLNASILGTSISLIILGVLSIVISRIVKGVDMVTLISFVMVILYLLGPLRVILNSIPQLTGIKVAWNRIKEFIRDLDVERDQDSVKKFVRNLDQQDKRDTINLKEIENLPKQVNNFKVEGLRFEYEPENEEVEKGFSIGPVDFEVNKGEILFIVGGNGSGKTTLAKLLTGLYKADEGITKINGKPMEDTKLGEFFSTIYSNYHLFQKLYSIDFVEKDKDIPKVLKLLQLDKKVKVREGKYSTLDLSGGQRKRLALFQCYMEDRPIYLFDELAADQDPEFRKFFYRELLVNMKKQEKIVIAITHDDHYFDVADKIIKMDMGKIDAVLNGREFNTEIAIPTQKIAAMEK